MSYWSEYAINLSALQIIVWTVSWWSLTCAWLSLSVGICAELRFIDYRPSSIAVAALLCAIQCTMPLICSESKKALTSMLPAGLQVRIWTKKTNWTKTWYEFYMINPNKFGTMIPNLCHNEDYIFSTHSRRFHTMLMWTRTDILVLNLKMVNLPWLKSQTLWAFSITC